MILMDVHPAERPPQMEAGSENVARREAKLWDEGRRFLPLRRHAIIHHQPADTTQEDL